MNFAKHLIDALGECADEEKYNIIHEMLKDVFSDPKDIETEYLSIYLPFFGNDEEVEVWEAQRQELIKKAAQAGVVEAQYDYGITEFERENYESSFELFLESARFGFAPALYCVGWAYFYGQGASVDKEKALYYIELAAGQLYSLAIDFLIHHYKDIDDKRERYEMMLSWAEHESQV